MSIKTGPWPSNCMEETICLISQKQFGRLELQLTSEDRKSDNLQPPRLFQTS